MPRTCCCHLKAAPCFWTGIAPGSNPRIMTCGPATRRGCCGASASSAPRPQHWKSLKLRRVRDEDRLHGQIQEIAALVARLDCLDAVDHVHALDHLPEHTCLLYTSPSP